MNQSTAQPINQSTTTQSTPRTKEAWTEPVLRKTPIAETAGSKPNALGDGSGTFSS